MNPAFQEGSYKNLRRERIGEGRRIPWGSTCDCVCDSLFALTSRWISLHQLRGSSWLFLSSDFFVLSPPASSSVAPAYSRLVFARGTQLVFACVSDLWWIGAGTARTGLGSRSPSTFRTLLDRAQGARARGWCRRRRCRRWVSSTRIGAEGIEQGTDRRAATGIYFYELCRRDRAASSLMFEPTHRH